MNILIVILAVLCVMVAVSELYYAIAVAGSIKDLDPTIFAMLPFYGLIICVTIKVFS